MAEIVDNPKGFKVIKMSLSETQKVFGSYGICDCCNRLLFEGFYIAVLHCLYCKDDYERFIETSFNYPEDRNIESANFEIIKQKLNL